MQALNKPSIVGVDWGTTHRRAYALDSNGTCINEFADNDGALACKGRFAQALNAAITALNADPELVAMSGMVGSALGWHEVPYLDESTSLRDLPRHLTTIKNTSTAAQCVVVPGFCVRNAQGQPDVMRGEETQLLGAVVLGHHTGWFVLPGTHSKWVELKQGRIVQLRTYMTGELYELLGRHGTVAAAIGTDPSVWNAEAFAHGVAAAGHGVLSNLLFGCRARVVCKDMPATHAKSYLSGLLIGSELKDVMFGNHNAGTAANFKLICSPELAIHYQAAAQQLSLSTEVLDARAAVIAATACIQSEWKPT